ncbi:MAG: cytochrome-c peroxidase [Myxococcales bacterium]|nr:cytochrome-c peroxidase [Myxococcales bacterium]
MLYNYANPDLPDHFRVPAVENLDNTPADNPVTDAGATLGRVLFYETALSQNESIACASCHEQSTGFSDVVALSEGFDGGHTGRNSMGLANNRYYDPGRYFWDERADTLEDQVLMPIQDSVEMGLTLDELVERVSARSYYAPLFEDAFGDANVTSDRISRALAQFVRAMVSYQSRFDEGLAQAGDILAPFPNFSDQENQGKALFLGPQARCGVCHLVNAPPPPGQPPTLANQAIFMFDRPSNNGLDANTQEDEGVGAVTGNPQQNGQFKIPSLRNIALTAPYMHDGRFETLADVIEHYNSGIQAHPNLDPVLRGPDNQPVQLNLTQAEKAALAAFLDTLTDDALLTDPKFSDPFVD